MKYEVNKIKKVISIILIFIGFIGIGFAADYAQDCENGYITGNNNIGYSCDICNGEIYKFNETKDGIDFYSKCCDGTAYNKDSGINAGISADECCETGVSVSNNGVNRVCKTCNGERFIDSNNGYEHQCCEGKKQFIPPTSTTNGAEICCEYGTVFIGGSCISCDTVSTIPTGRESNCTSSVVGCPTAQLYIDSNGTTMCCKGTLVDSQENPGTKTCILNNEGTAGMTMNADCLTNGQCSLNIYKTLGIRKSDQDPSVGSFVQDIVLASTTFIGTVIALVLVLSGILYVISSINGKSTLAEKAKSGIINSIVGLILVIASYAIVRLIQFLATAGGG